MVYARKYVPYPQPGQLLLEPGRPIPLVPGLAGIGPGIPVSQYGCRPAVPLYGRVQHLDGVPTGGLFKHPVPRYEPGSC